jgi:uncharacterized membrane protein
MLTAAWVCVLAWYASGDERWDRRARLFEVAGVLVLPPTIAAAFIDTRGFGFIIHPRADAPLIWHMTAGLVAAATFTSHLLWRRRRTPQSFSRRLAATDVAMVTLGMGALLAAGLIAAEMVYAA